MATIKFQQTSKNSAQAKMRRLVGNANYGTIGFCNVMLKKEFETEYDEYAGKNAQYYIELSSTYHSESVMQSMYKTNGKVW